MNKKIFKNVGGQPIATDTVNEAGGTAYKYNDKQALAQLMVTATFHDSYYKTGEGQVKELLEVLERVYETEGPEFIAKAIVYARTKGYMKDTPALALVWLSNYEEGRQYVKRIWHQVVDNSKMLRNVVTVVRSGVTGRKNFGSVLRKLIQNWFDTNSADYIFRGSVGKPTLGEIIRMVHVKPNSPEKAALYSYLADAKPRGDTTAEDLPQLVKDYVAFNAGESNEVPAVPFQMLTSRTLPTEVWKEIAKNGKFQWTRMNLNTMVRQGVLEDQEMVDIVSAKLSDADAVKKSRQFPHQLWMSAKMAMANSDMPRQVQKAMQDALDASVENVPAFEGEVWAFPDMSGSMNDPVTGWRGSATSQVRCWDVSSLLSAVIKKRSSGGHVLPFTNKVYPEKDKVNPFDSVLTIQQKITENICGGTSLSAPLQYLLDNNIKARVLIWLSDMQSWCDSSGITKGGFLSAPDATFTMELWKKYRRRNPGARAIFINLNSGTTGQSYDKTNEILNIGGWSDSIWEIIADFSKGNDPTKPKNWVELISKTEI